MSEEEYVIPVDIAIDTDKGFKSVAYREWLDQLDLVESDDDEDIHAYQITDAP